MLQRQSHRTMTMLLPLIYITAMLALVAAGKLLPFSLLIAADAITHCATTAACAKKLLPRCAPDVTVFADCQ